MEHTKSNRLRSPAPALHPAFGQLTVRFQHLIGFLVLLQHIVFSKKGENLANDVFHLFSDAVKHPLIYLAGIHNVGVFEVGNVARGLGLRKIEYVLQV